MSAVEKVELSGSQGTQTGFWAGQSPSRAGQKTYRVFLLHLEKFRKLFQRVNSRFSTKSREKQQKCQQTRLFDELFLKNKFKHFYLVYCKQKYPICPRIAERDETVSNEKTGVDK